VLKFVEPQKSSAVPPRGIERRVALTTSTVVGSPDPPPPFRVRRAYPNLKINFPVCVVRQPGTDLLIFITQNYPYAPTAIYRMKDDPDVASFETVLTMKDDVAYDITFHPRFAENGYVYIGNNGPGPGGKKHSRVTRYTMDRQPPYRLDPNSAKVIIEWPSDGHNGAAVAFGHDGMLYVTSGDGTSDSDTNVTGQDMTQLLAKVLRIDIDHPEGDKAYSVPKDNPFVGRADVVPETWAFGLRNPWRMTVDAKAGHIWVAQNGQDLWEQAFLVRRGDNYGWSVFEGSHPFYPNRKLGPAPHVKPTVEHHHSEARSLTGGVVYYGQMLPELTGAYIYGDYSTGKIWGVSHDGEKIVWHKELADTTLQITGFGVDTRGELMIADHRGGDQGAFYTFERTPEQKGPSRFPRKLSESGLFRSVKGHVMHSAMIPYTVNAPLWSDGAYKERYLGLPGDDPKIEVTATRGWNFPDQTVVVKSFALEMEEGNPLSRRWIETRFLTRQEGEWVGYSYLWNDEQTDATLVDAKGADKVFEVRTRRSRENPEGVRKQTWHYPSRAECMVCHSRAANWVLGLTTLQMNKEHRYGEVRDSQLRVLEHLGVLKIDYGAETLAKMREELSAEGKSEKEIDEEVRRQTESRLQGGSAGPGGMLSFSPEEYARLVDPYDPAEDLDRRARSYLHANCSQCHVEAGGGNAQIDLEFTAKAEKTRMFDVRPVHHTFGLPEARLVAPGAPERSVLLHRMSHRQAGHMPPLATGVVDEQAVELIREWIEQMKR
jgi:glucose/arabinose dehydrogenase